MLYPHVFILFYPWTYILNVKISSRESANIFSVSVYVFRDLFWQICPLFVQVLIKCLKCSRASSSLSSYSKKLRCERGWDLYWIYSRFVARNTLYLIFFRPYSILSQSHIKFLCFEIILVITVCCSFNILLFINWTGVFDLILL